MSDENTVREGLEDALSEASETSTEETERETKAEASATSKDDKGKKPGPVPYDRFKETNEKVKALEEALAAREEELESRSKTLDKMAQALDAKEADAAHIQKIRELYASGDDKWRPILEQLEKRLAGIEEEIEEATEGDENKEVPKKLADQQRKALESLREELQDEAADIRADQIVDKADKLAEALLDQLPEEYTDRDKKAIAHLWSDQVDWERIETSEDWNSALQEELPKTLDYILNEVYDEPEGKIVQRVRAEFEEKGQITEPEPSPTERLKALQEREWGKFEVQKDEKGSVKSFNPETSDEDFSRAMADALRASRAAEEAARKAS